MMQPITEKHNPIDYINEEIDTDFYIIYWGQWEGGII